MHNCIRLVYSAEEPTKLPNQALKERIAEKGREEVDTEIRIREISKDS